PSVSLCVVGDWNVAVRCEAFHVSVPSIVPLKVNCPVAPLDASRSRSVTLKLVWKRSGCAAEAELVVITKPMGTQDAGPATRAALWPSRIRAKSTLPVLLWLAVVGLVPRTTVAGLTPQ